MLLCYSLVNANSTQHAPKMGTWMSFLSQGTLRSLKGSSEKGCQAWQPTHCAYKENH